MRAFVAIDLPEAIHAALARRQAEFRDQFAPGEPRPAERIAWTRPEGIHLTLKFLGQITDAQVSALSESITALATRKSFEKFTVEVKGFGFFPGSQRPRVFWAGIEAPAALAELAARVEGVCQELGFAPESRPFAPHLTLARFKNPRPQPALEALLQQQGNASLGSFEVTEFFLFESKLAPSGAQYRKVAKFPA